MANLAKTAVTLIDSWYGGGLNGRKFTYKYLSVVLTAQGTVANRIPSTVIGFTKIFGCTPLVNSADNLIVVGSPDTAQTTLLLKAAGTNAPADFTDTFRMVVWGKS